MPDGNPKYEKVPRPESIIFFENGTKNHKSVSMVTQSEPCYYKVERIGKNAIFVQLNNIYIVSVADVHEIINSHKDVNCIVTMSAWNSYSNSAKAFCKSLGIGLFKYNEYYGALNYENEGFYNYEPPTDND